MKMPSAEETTYLIEVMSPEQGLHHSHHLHHHHHHQEASFTSRDVDVLVSRIKENLRLSGQLKSRSSLAQQHKLRTSPYSLPSRCELCSAGGELVSTADESTEAAYRGWPGYVKPQQQQQQHHHHHHRCRKAVAANPTTFDLDDSYERFQALLRNGALIKEAVKRLLEDDKEDVEPEEEDDNEDESHERFGSRRSRAPSYGYRPSTTFSGAGSRLSTGGSASNATLRATMP